MQIEFEAVLGVAEVARGLVKAIIAGLHERHEIVDRLADESIKQLADLKVAVSTGDEPRMYASLGMLLAIADVHWEYPE